MAIGKKLKLDTRYLGKDKKAQVQLVVNVCWLVFLSLLEYSSARLDSLVSLLRALFACTHWFVAISLQKNSKSILPSCTHIFVSRLANFPSSESSPISVENSKKE